VLLKIVYVLTWPIPCLVVLYGATGQQRPKC
jgi:hypothetical protein